MKKNKLKVSIRESIAGRRATINSTETSLIKTRYLKEDQVVPLIIEPVRPGVNLARWTEQNKEYLHDELAKHGAILFHDFAIDTSAKFEEVVSTVSTELFDEYGDLPRDTPGAKVYHSTPYPSDKSILFHNESSHMHRWPMQIWFYCVKAAEKGGATPIVDCRKAYQYLDPAIIKRLTEKKLLYARTFVEGLDVSWQQFFQTSSKEHVEAYCRKAAIDFTWKDGGNRLKTRQISPAVVRHPHTGEMVLFNQIQLHHISFLEPAVRESMLTMFGNDDLPRNVCYGDGTPLEDSVVQEISAVLDELAVRFQWTAGDVIMLDNMMIAHARDPFEGTRKILVAMADIITQQAVLQNG